jgi:hypothetical protein
MGDLGCGEGHMLELNVDLRDRVRAVCQTSQAVTTELQRSGLSGLAEDAGPAAGELVADAVMHGAAPIQVRRRRRGAGRRLMVQDASALRPEFLDAGPEQTVGRGMTIVAAVAAAWGCEHLGEGNVMWCDLPSGLTEEEGGAAVPAEEAGLFAEPVSFRHPDPVQRCTVRVPDVPVRAFRDYVLQVEEQLWEQRPATNLQGPSAMAALGEQIGLDGEPGRSCPAAGSGCHRRASGSGTYGRDAGPVPGGCRGGWAPLGGFGRGRLPLPRRCPARP